MSRARLATLALGILAASLTLAACGEDDQAATTATTATTEPSAAEPTELRRRFEAQIREALERQDTRVDPDCVIDRLRDTLPNRAVEASVGAIEADEEIPQEAVDAAFEAGSECERSPAPN